MVIMRPNYNVNSVSYCNNRCQCRLTILQIETELNAEMNHIHHAILYVIRMIVIAKLSNEINVFWARKNETVR